MTNVAFQSIADYRDIETLNIYHEMVEAKGMHPDAVLAILHAKSRDNARTPMQWDDSPQAGFTSGTPWIKLNPNYPQINVKAALADPESIFHYYQTLIQLRQHNPVMVYGSYDLILESHPHIYAFTRSLESERMLVILNFSGSAPVFSKPGSLSYSSAELLISNYPVDATQELSQFSLRPYEARVYRLRP